MPLTLKQECNPSFGKELVIYIGLPYGDDLAATSVNEHEGL